MRLTEQQLAEIEARTTAVSPGEWWADAYRVWTDDWHNKPDAAVMFEGKHMPYYDGDGGRYLGADLDFVVSARRDIPALLAEVRRCHALIQQAEWEAEGDGWCVCPWCRSGEGCEDGEKRHLATCPAFGSEA